MSGEDGKGTFVITVKACDINGRRRSIIGLVTGGEGAMRSVIARY